MRDVGGNMIEIGSFIKMQRTKQKMTLGELADGIISVSYLSKIENLKTEASPSIIQLLCNRLGIELENNLEEVIKEKCEEWFEMLFHNHNAEDLKEVYEQIQRLMDRNLSENMVLFEIHKIRYFLILNDMPQALDQINALNNMVNSFDTKQLYFWFKFRGIYSSIMGENAATIEKYKRAENLVKKSDVSEEEIADLHYIMSITYGKLQHTLEAIDYANQAIDVFMKKYNFVRCAQCHIMLGISYRRIKMYDKAIENYNLAKHLASLDNNHEIIQLTNQNLGYLNSVVGNMKEANEFYTEIMEHDEVAIVEKLAAITELIKVNYEIESFEKVHEFMDLAMNLLKEYPQHPEHEYYHYVIHTYYYSLNNEHERFVDIVKNQFIPFLRKHNDYASIGTFASMLAKHYESIHKYKDATKFYKLSNQAYKELSNI